MAEEKRIGVEKRRSNIFRVVRNSQITFQGGVKFYKDSELKVNFSTTNFREISIDVKSIFVASKKDF